RYTLDHISITQLYSIHDVSSFPLFHRVVAFCSFIFFFFFNDTATTEIYTLSLHDALPISSPHPRAISRASRRRLCRGRPRESALDRKSTRLNSSHLVISYAVFCLKKKKKKTNI